MMSGVRGLVDEDIVDFVDDGEVELTLYALVDGEGHIVAQVVEAELVVGAVGNVGAIGFGSGDWPQEGQLSVGHFRVVQKGGVVLQTADTQAEGVVDGTHPHRIAAGEVVVDGDHVNAVAGQGVSVDRQGSHEGLSLAGLHLGDLALVEGRAADELDVVVALAKVAPGRLADRGEGFGQQGVDGVASVQPLSEFVGLGQQLVVAEALIFGLQPVDVFPDGAQLLKSLVIGVADYFLENGNHRP